MDLTLNDASSDATELYAKFGAPPTRADYDYSSTPRGRQTRISSSPWQPGVPGTSWSMGTPSPPPTSIPSSLRHPRFFSPARRPTTTHTAPATLTLTGAGFISSTAVSLVAQNGTVYQAATASADSLTRITATFAANTVPAGTYSVEVSRARRQLGGTRERLHHGPGRPGEPGDEPHRPQRASGKT